MDLDHKINLRGANEALLEPWKSRGKSRLATRLPRFALRGDSRSPDVIFGGGFESRGTSTDLARHLLDNTDPPSAYIATSRAFDIARDFGPYVYAIRPRNALNTNALVWRGSPMEEISIPWRVLPEDIPGVTLLKPDGTLVGYSMLNPKYRPK